MAEDPLHDIIETVRARLKTELETQLETLSARHQQALEEQRAQIEAEAEQRWAPQLQAARAEIEHHAAAAAAARAALDDLQESLARERALVDSRNEDQRGEAGTIAAGASPDPASLVDRLRTIDAATSLSASLAAIVSAASSDSSRAALYLVNGTGLEQFEQYDRPGPHRSGHDLNTPGDSITLDAFRSGQPVSRDGSAHAVPMLLEGTPVAVLYGEVDAEWAGTAAWAESLEAVARHGAARIGYLTALRTAQARQWLAASAAAPSASSNNTGPPDDAVASARRYAKLVISEIKLYNESAVEEGRSRRDLQTRLGPEIDRARRLFEEHVPASVPARSEYFQQELIQTLAGGDPSLLG